MVGIALGLSERLCVPSSSQPTFFGIVRKTLDRGYARIKGQRDEKIKAQIIVKMSDSKTPSKLK